jgi:hypothetical protein
MKRTTIPICHCLLMIIGLAAASVAVPQPGTAPPLSGSYKIIKSEKNGQTEAQVTVQLHLVNRTPRDLHIQRMTLWDFSHPLKGGTHACSLVVHSSASAGTTQQFTIPRSELDLWKRGTKPRLVLELAAPNGHPSTAVVRLDRASGKEY